MKRSLFLNLFFITFIFSSCSDRPILTIKDTVDGAWKYHHPLVYELDIVSNSEKYNLILSLDYSTEFSHQNLYVKIITEYPDKSKAEDIISLNLTDGAGTFLGNCSGNKCTIDILLQDSFLFKQTGSHTISIYQHSRNPMLENIFGGELKLYRVNIDNE